MISSYQLLCIMLLSRISSEIFYPAVGGYDFTTIAAAASAEIIQLLAALPVILYSIHGKSFYAAIARKSRIGGWAIGLAAAFLLALLSVNAAIFAAEFAQRTVLAGMSGAVTAILIVAFALYTTVKGAEAAARSSVLILAGSAVITVVTVIAAVPHMRPLALQPDVNEDFPSQLYEQLTRGGEYMLFAALLPHVSRKEKTLSPCGAALSFCAISILSVLLIQLFGMTVLGEFYSLAEYPFTAAAQLSDIALFKRLDGFTAAVWAVAGAMRCALFLYAEYSVIKAVRSSRKGDTHETDTHRSDNGGLTAA